jgi:hypothetical protein
MHVECYQRVLEDIERGVLGDSGEDTKPGNKQLKRYLDGAEDAKRRAAAYERNKQLLGEDAAKRIYEVAEWIMKIKRQKPNFTDIAHLFYLLSTSNGNGLGDEKELHITFTTSEQLR